MHLSPNFEDTLIVTTTTISKIKIYSPKCNYTLHLLSPGWPLGKDETIFSAPWLVSVDLVVPCLLCYQGHVVIASVLYRCQSLWIVLPQKVKAIESDDEDSLGRSFSRQLVLRIIIGTIRIQSESEESLNWEWWCCVARLVLCCEWVAQ